MNYSGDDELVARLSIIDENGTRGVRMAPLATVGSFAVNGVAALHTDLLKSTVMRDFHAMWPEKFHNVTNGVTLRRFLRLSNPGLSGLITSSIGSESWISNLEELRRLEAYADDSAFQQEWNAVKLANKRRLANDIKGLTGIDVDTERGSYREIFF